MAMAKSGINEAAFYDEFNKLSSIELCIQAQELIQDIMNRFSDISNYLKPLVQQTLDANTFTQRKLKLDEYLYSVDTLFIRLKLYAKLITQRQNDLNQQQYANLNETQQKIDQLKQQQVDLHKRIKEKNDYIKLAIDNLYSIIWQINAMQSVKSVN